VNRESLAWQSKLILLLVLPVVGCGVVFETHKWFAWSHAAVYWTLGLSAALGILTLALRAATAFAAITGTLITAQLIYATSGNPFKPWETFLVPVLLVAALAHIATRIGRAKKERLGTAEGKRGRSASQVAANLGAAALFSTSMAQVWASNHNLHFDIMLAASLAAMGEAAADTVSSEIGQVFGGTPRMITTLKAVERGTDGGITLAGTLAGVVAAAIVTAVILPFGAQLPAFAVLLEGAVAGLFFDSLLGATLERRGWLNNDAVNFLSTIFAGVVAVGLATKFVHFYM
jgi:uncharacterized protein (TIGR00297 family)